MTPRSIRNVIFDFGGVLVRWQPTRIIDDFYPDPLLRDALRTHVFQHPDWLAMDRGTLTEPELATRFAARMRRPVEEMRALLEHVRSSLTPIEPSVALLRDLRVRGYSLYGLSNMSEPMFAHLKASYDFFASFEGIVISGAAKLVKPEPAIYEHLRSTFDLDFAESVFIDDLPQNITAAERIGLRGIRFEDAAQCRLALAAFTSDGL